MNGINIQINFTTKYWFNMSKKQITKTKFPHRMEDKCNSKLMQLKAATDFKYNTLIQLQAN